MGTMIGTEGSHMAMLHETACYVRSVEFHCSPDSLYSNRSRPSVSSEGSGFWHLNHAEVLFKPRDPKAWPDGHIRLVRPIAVKATQKVIVGEEKNKGRGSRAGSRDGLV